jgi:ribosomal protein S27AE
MTNETEDAPCARGCTWAPADEDEPPRPKPAKHGHLCNSCFYRLTGALKLVPDLMANMRAQLWSLGAADYSQRVSGGGSNSPAPLNIGPLDASDALFAKLHSWVGIFAADFHVAAPVIPTWSNHREVQGSRIVSVETATRRAAQLTQWFLSRMEEIAATRSAMAFHDDITAGWEDSRGVFSLSAQYGVKARPTPEAEKRECPTCGVFEVFMKMPDAFDAEYAVICGRCGWIEEPQTKLTGKASVAPIVTNRPGTCVVCALPIERGTLINRVEGLTIHDGCQGIIEPKEQHADRKMDHPKAVVVDVGQPRAVLASVALVAPRVLPPQLPSGLVSGRAGVRDEPREAVTRFVAKYPGRCAGGCDGIEPGDVVELEDGALMHTDCENSEGMREEGRRTETCTECWTIKPCACGEF